MRPDLILLSRPEGAVEAQAWPCGVPGLRVVETSHDSMNCVTPAWSIVHARSGLCVWRCLGDPETALDRAQRISDLTDWTQRAEELRTVEIRRGLIAVGAHAHGNVGRGRDLNGVRS